MPTGNHSTTTPSTTSTPSTPSTTSTSGPGPGLPATADAKDAKPGFGLSAAHIGGTTLAAVTSAVGASTFGVGGTIAGAAFGSVVSTVGGTVYSASLERAGKRLRTGAAGLQRPGRVPGAAPGTQIIPPVADTAVVPGAATTSADATAPDADATVPLDPAAPAEQAGAEAAPPAPSIWQRIRWKPAAVLAGVAFVAGLGFITVSELVLDRPLADAAGGGTSVGRVFGGGVSTADTTPTPSPSDVSSVSPTGDVQPSASPDAERPEQPTPGNSGPQTTSQAPAPTTAAPTAEPTATSAP